MARPGVGVLNTLLGRLAPGARSAPTMRFGEVWWIRNRAWSQCSELRHLEHRAGVHPGLCIKPQARIMAFGTSKVHRARRMPGRQLKVPAQSYPGASRDGVFLLDYAIPVAWHDVALTIAPGLLPEVLRQRLRVSMGETDG